MIPTVMKQMKNVLRTFTLRVHVTLSVSLVGAVDDIVVVQDTTTTI